MIHSTTGYLLSNFNNCKVKSLALIENTEDDLKNCNTTELSIARLVIK